MTTTFVDPFGITAEVIASVTVSSKTGIVPLTATGSMPYVEIPHDCGWMVAAVSGTGHVSLPPGSAVGDIVEIHALGGTVTAHGQSGESVVSSGEVQSGAGSFFRKITSTSWVHT